MISCSRISVMLRRMGYAALSTSILTLSLSSLAGQDSLPPAVKKSASAAATEAGEPQAAKAADPYAVPEGSPEEILRFIEELQELRPKFKNREELIHHVTRVQQATVAASDKLLAHQDADEKTAVEAVELKMQSLVMLVRLGRNGALEATLKAARDLTRDPRKGVAAKAREILLAIRIGASPTLPDDQRQALIAEVLEAVAASQFSRESVGTAYALGQTLEEAGKRASASECYEKLSELLSKSEDPELNGLSVSLKGYARGLQLPGKFMELGGTTLSGKPLDWNAYRGKVVLVDFWATWCGPCLEELPNVQRLYQLYHDKGFEVVGVSLDEDRPRLEAFLEREQIPWTTLIEPDPAARGWKHPLAVRYGIRGIPAAILVNEDGKVISMAARGPELAAQLEKLLGPAEVDAPVLKKFGVFKKQ